MPNMSATKVPVTEQKPDERNRNFKEVCLGYTEEEAVLEAQRCLNCKHKPCMSGCPVNVKIPEFIALIAEKKFEEAYLTIRETSTLPAVCGRVCPQENQCEKNCVRALKGEPVAIGRLERFAADWYMNNVKAKVKKSEQNGKKVAVVGGGPSGLTCAGDLASMGYQVHIFEAFHTLGGVLMYGIPEFRLPKDIVQAEIKKLEEMGVCVHTDMVIGKVLSIDELLNDEGFDAVFISTGAGLPSFMNIEGESLNGVYSANEFLTRINLMKAYRFPEYDTPIYIGKNVVVFGGGNVAMDAARSAKRMGAGNVSIVYRRSEEEMPASREEVHHAKEEGIDFKLFCNPVRILGTEDGWAEKVECVKMELGEADASGRRRPIEVKDSEFLIDAETVIVAIGQTPNPLIRNTTPDIETNSKGCIIVKDMGGRTSKEAVWAGGDAVTGAATVILAMGAGKSAASEIARYLESK